MNTISYLVELLRLYVNFMIGFHKSEYDEAHSEIGLNKNL